MAAVVNTLTESSHTDATNPFAVGALPDRREYFTSELHAEILAQARRGDLWEAGEDPWSLVERSSSPIFKHPNSPEEIDVWLATVLYASRAAVNVRVRDQRFDQILLGVPATDRRDEIEAAHRDLLYLHGGLLWQEDCFENAMLLWATVLTVSSLFAAAGLHSIFFPSAPQALPTGVDPLADKLCGYLVAGMGVAGPTVGLFGCAYTLFHSNSAESHVQRALSYLAQIELTIGPPNYALDDASSSRSLQKCG